MLKPEQQTSVDVAQILRKANKPVFIAVNKVDNAMEWMMLWNFAWTRRFDFIN